MDSVGGPADSVMAMVQLTHRRPVKAPVGFAQGGPRTLAALRIAAGVAALLTFRSLSGFVIPPETLRFPPPGTAWLSFLPASQRLYDVAVIVGLVAAVGVVVGLRPRWTASVATAATFYAGWVTTLTGKVDHFHHVMWVLAILAVSPCANVWAVRREDRAGSYRWPVTAVIVLLGLMYFGPGLAKLRSAGLEWGWSDNLTNLLYIHAWEKGHAVPWVADFPLLGRFLGLGALIFELAFLPMLLIPKVRRWVWPAGVLFHFATAALMGISFLTLQLMYVAFLPLDEDNDERETNGQRRLIVPLVAAVAMFSIFGLSSAWPVASYPGFEGVAAEATITDIEVTTDGETGYLTDSPMTEKIGGPWRLMPLAWSAIREGESAALVEWLGADSLTVVTIDTRTGQVVSRSGY